jgi:23S rRNA (uracil1939-C5)-methyltransferase
MAKERFEVDVVIMDPPREGSKKQFISAIGYLNPKKVVYVSCDPKTLKRDLYDFGENGYYVTKLEGFDNFPRTQHIECVVLLEKK